jgi:tetratricopeptide (TPR) repeat protein
LELLGRLVDHSLVLARDSDGEPRFGMLDTIREYACEKLLASADADEVRDRHAAHYRELAIEAEPALMGPDQVLWLERLDLELDNIRAALGWLLESSEERDGGRCEQGLLLAADLWRFWHTRGHIGEGRMWLERGLSVCPAARPEVRAKALSKAGWHAHVQGDLDIAEQQLQEAVSLTRAAADEQELAFTLEGLGDVKIFQGNYAEGKRLHEEGLEIRRRLGDSLGIAMSLNSLGAVALQEGDAETAKSLLEQTLVMVRPLGDQRMVAVTAHNLGMVALRTEDYDHAVEPLREALRLFYAQGNKQDSSFCLDALARVAGAKGDVTRSARLFGAAAAMRGEINAKLPPFRVEWQEQAMAESRAAHNQAEWEQAWQEGRTMSLDRIVTYALGQSTD